MHWWDWEALTSHALVGLGGANVTYKTVHHDNKSDIFIFLSISFYIFSRQRERERGGGCSYAGDCLVQCVTA